MTIELALSAFAVFLSLYQLRLLIGLHKEIVILRNQLSNCSENEAAGFKDGVIDLNARLDALQNMRFSYMGNTLRKERQR